MNTKLKPCPWCGAGLTSLRENGKIWTGQRYSEPQGWAVICDGKRASYIYADKETAEEEVLEVGGTARAVRVYIEIPQ